MKTRITFLLLMWMSLCLTLSAQTNAKISIDFKETPLPTALKRLEQASGYRILFTYSDVENYQVTTSLQDVLITQAMEKVLAGKPLSYQQKGDEYIVIFRKEANRKPVSIRGSVIDEKNNPMPYCNVLLLSPDSTFVNGCVTQNDGSFLMTGEEGTPYLLKVSYIGYATTTQNIQPHNLIQLLPDAQALGEVTVVAERPMIEAKANGLKANVVGTPLAKMGTANDMLSHLPFVSERNGNYQVIGYGTPEIYINNRKVRDMSELDRLRADEIVSTEIITVPGAEYASNVASVIRIKTIKKRGQGWSGSIQTNYSQGEKSNESGQFALNYRTGGLDIFANGHIRRNTLYGHSTSSNTLEGSSLWESHDQTIRDNVTNLFNGTLGFNFEFNDKHAIGMRYTPNTNFGHSLQHVTSEMTMNRDGELYEKMDVVQDVETKNKWKHSVNGYYEGKIGKWKIDVNADYYFGENGSIQNVTNDGVMAATSENDIRSYLYAIKAMASTSLKKGTLSFGTEETFTNRHDVFKQSGFSADANSHVKQNAYSIFANYSVGFGKWKLNTGLRYERQETDYYDNGIYQAEKSPAYNDLVPTLAINYNPGKWNYGFSYRLHKNNPSYSHLTNNISYRNKYEYFTGNPLLQPQKTNYFSLTAGCQWLYLEAYYQYVKDSYMTVLQPYNDETHPGVTLIRYQTNPDIHQYGVMANITRKIGFWWPSFTTQIQFRDGAFEEIGIKHHWNEPNFYFYLDNSFNLPKGWFINLQGYIVTATRTATVNSKTSGAVNGQISKTFLKEKNLTVRLSFNDIFHTQHNAMTSYGIQTSTTFSEYYDHQRVGITVSYKFNSTKSKYKGTGAGQSEKSRL